MMTVFRLEMDDHSAALACIVEHLSQPQRAALVVAKVRAGSEGPARVYDNLNVTRSMTKGAAPLVEEDDLRWVLSELGHEVARYLIQSGDFMVPILGVRPRVAA